MCKVNDYLLGISEDLTTFSKDFDVYSFRNCYDDDYDAIVDNMEMLMDDPEPILEWLEDCYESMADDAKLFKNELIECKSLIARVKTLV